MDKEHEDLPGDKSQLGKCTIFDVLSVHNVLRLARPVENASKAELNLVLNRILDSMFKVKSANADIIHWDPKSSIDDCDYDFVYHFIESKLSLGKKADMIRNKKLLALVKNTYEGHKAEYIKKEKLVPSDNRWTKLIIMMNWLKLLDKSEKGFWIEKYASYKFTESEPKLPQAWNRVWVFTTGLGILNIDDLKKIKDVDFAQAKDIICSYVPKIKDLLEQNVFNESKDVMLVKYIKIREFCNMPFFEDIDYLLH